MTRRDWGEPGAMLACVVMFVGFPNRYTLGPPAMTWAFGLFTAAMFLIALYSTLDANRRLLRSVMFLGSLVLATGLGLSLFRIVLLIVYHSASIDGIRLLETALFIWIGNVVMFAIMYHLIDKGDFAFPHGGDATSVAPNKFLDYIFLSYTTATAFSPTDTAPLSTRARMLMMAESLISLVTIAIAAARAVNILT